jgi:hypothetical protein
LQVLRTPSMSRKITFIPATRFLGEPALLGLTPTQQGEENSVSVLQAAYR